MNFCIKQVNAVLKVAKKVKKCFKAEASRFLQYAFKPVVGKATKLSVAA